MLGGAARRRILGLLAVGLLAAAAGLALHATGLLGWLERPTVDARFSLRGRQAPPRDVILVGIDNSSLGQLPRYPFSRTLDARVLERLHAAGARLIVYDISFDRPTTPAADTALYEAARQAAPVVFGTSLISSTGATLVLGGNANLTAIGDRAAAADLIPDPDGVLRHTLAKVNGLPSIAAAVAQVIAEREPPGARPSPALGGQPASSPEPNPTPAGHAATQANGGWIDFAGPPDTVRSLSFARVLDGRFDRAAVHGKVVVIGATAPVLQDMHSTAAGSPMSGPEVQADAIATALDGFPLRSPSGIVTAILIVTLALLVPLACLTPLPRRFPPPRSLVRSRPLPMPHPRPGTHGGRHLGTLGGRRPGTLGACLIGLSLTALWSLATQLAFDSGTVLDYSDPLAALALGTAGTAMLGMWADSRERRRLRELFAANDSGVVDRVLHRPGERPLEPTAIIAGYRLEEVVGRGGMGIVYRATQMALDRPVAIKLIAAERAGDPVFRERFISESRIAASVEHANVIPVYEAGEDDGLLFIAMRLVDGFDLGALLARTGPLKPDRAAHVITQVAGALDAAHAHGLVHRDVKPANVLLTADPPEHAYLTDFGLAKHAGALTRVTRAGQWVGTLDYLAPEQLRGEAADARADIYALTCVLYHCLTGTTPYPRDSEAAIMWAHISAPTPRPSDVRPDLPDELDRAIARGMAKEPGERFATAGELADACAQALGIAYAEDAPTVQWGGADPSEATPGPPVSGGPAPTILSD